jgi:peptidylprolyl isomerase
MSRSFAVRLTILLSLVALVFAACGGGDEADVVEGDGGVVQGEVDVVGEEVDVVADGDNVSVQYTGTLDDGEVFDSNVGGATLDFTVGAGQMITGFDAAVVGMAVGETKTVTLEPAEAYGEYEEARIIEIDRASAPEDVAAGQQLVDNRGARVVVVEVRDDVVVIDTNHPLAGQSLTFEIQLVAITR